MVSREVLKREKYCQYKVVHFGYIVDTQLVYSIVDVIKQGIKLLALRKLGKCLNTVYFLEICVRDFLKC